MTIITIVITVVLLVIIWMMIIIHGMPPPAPPPFLVDDDEEQEKEEEEEEEEEVEEWTANKRGGGRGQKLITVITGAADRGVTTNKCNHTWQRWHHVITSQLATATTGNCFKTLGNESQQVPLISFPSS